VYPSSTTVYGAWPGSGFHSEDEPPKPLPGFTYSEHKVAAERVLLSGPARPTVIVLRGCVVVGGGAESFILSSLGLPLIPLPSGADPPMQFLHIDDYVTAVEAAAAARRGGIFNVAGTGTIRLQELIEALGSRSIGIPELLLRRLIDVSWRLRLQSRSPAAGLALVRHPWLASIEKIRSRLGWEPRRSSEEAIGAWAAGR
jgi:UDP-glucose 4-epimerase